MQCDQTCNVDIPESLNMKGADKLTKTPGGEFSVLYQILGREDMEPSE